MIGNGVQSLASPELQWGFESVILGIVRVTPQFWA